MGKWSWMLLLAGVLTHSTETSVLSFLLTEIPKQLKVGKGSLNS